MVVEIVWALKQEGWRGRKGGTLHSDGGNILVLEAGGMEGKKGGNFTCWWWRNCLGLEAEGMEGEKGGDFTCWWWKYSRPWSRRDKGGTFHVDGVEIVWALKQKEWKGRKGGTLHADGGNILGFEAGGMEGEKGGNFTCWWWRLSGPWSRRDGGGEEGELDMLMECLIQNHGDWRGRRGGGFTCWWTVCLGSNRGVGVSHYNLTSDSWATHLKDRIRDSLPPFSTPEWCR